MVFQKDNRLKVALFVPKEEVTGQTLRREDACSLALREMEAAGLAPKERMEIEAFENPEGWMVFASAPIVARELTCWFRFASADDFLDTYRTLTAHSVVFTGWETPGEGFLLTVKGTPEQIKAISAPLKEFATPFEAPELLAEHLSEQLTMNR